MHIRAAEPGFSRATIYLDGVPMTDVMQANEEEGWVQQILSDPITNVVLQGTVRIDLPPGLRDAHARWVQEGGRDRMHGEAMGWIEQQLGTEASDSLRKQLGNKAVVSLGLIPKKDGDDDTSRELAQPEDS